MTFYEDDGAASAATMADTRDLIFTEDVIGSTLALTQPPARSADTAGMRTVTFTWHALAADAGILELDRRVTTAGRALQLHVVRDSETGASLAWWQTGRGEWLGCVEAGGA